MRCKCQTLEINFAMWGFLHEFSCFCSVIPDVYLHSGLRRSWFLSHLFVLWIWCRIIEGSRNKYNHVLFVEFWRKRSPCSEAYWLFPLLHVYFRLAEYSTSLYFFIPDQRTGVTVACTACTEPSLPLLLLPQRCCPTHAVPRTQDVLQALLHVLHCGGWRY